MPCKVKLKITIDLDSVECVPDDELDEYINMLFDEHQIDDGLIVHSNTIGESIGRITEAKVLLDREYE